MRENQYNKFISKTRAKEIFKQCGLTFADDKIVEDMFVFEMYYTGSPRQFAANRKSPTKGNPRAALIEEAYQIIRKEILLAREREIKR